MMKDVPTSYQKGINAKHAGEWKEGMNIDTSIKQRYPLRANRGVPPITCNIHLPALISVA